MGHYVSVRGWIEVDADMLQRVRHLIKEFPKTFGDAILAPEQVRSYSQGWVIPEDGSNWTRYCFYGADIRREGLPWFLAQLHVIAQALVEHEEQQGEMAGRYDGVFFVDDDEGEMSLMWYIQNGQVIEKAHSPVPLPMQHGAAQG